MAEYPEIDSLINSMFSLGVDACVPSQRAYDAHFMSNALVVVDSREAALTESGDIIHSKVGN